MVRVKICCISSIEEAKTAVAAGAAAVGLVRPLPSGPGVLNLAVKELGGTGRAHNWAISRKITEGIGKPLFLAGGMPAMFAQHWKSSNLSDSTCAAAFEPTAGWMPPN